LKNIRKREYCNIDAFGLESPQSIIAFKNLIIESSYSIFFAQNIVLNRLSVFSIPKIESIIKTIVQN